MVRLISMAMTGYYRTLMRPRVHRPLSMMKYDPIGTILRTPILKKHALPLALRYASFQAKNRIQEMARPVAGLAVWGRTWGKGPRGYDKTLDIG
jgi:hypothetical protein